MNKKILLLFVLFTSVGCSSLIANEGKESMSPLEKIEYWKSVFLEGEKTPQEFVAMITNDVDYTFLDDGDITFESRDIYFGSGYLSFGKNKADYFELKIKPGAHVKLSELERIWGKAKKGLMHPSDGDTVVVFEDIPVKPGDKYKTSVRAYIDGEIELKESNLLEFKVRREELIDSTSE